MSEDMRERLAEIRANDKLVHDLHGSGWDEHATDAEIDRADLLAMLAARDEEVERLQEERDLAIAHDRQPYPTAWAYEQACKALEKHRQRADAAEAAIERVRDAVHAASRIVATSSRDWSLNAGDAWLYALLVGWDCELAEHAGGGHDKIDCGGPNRLENFAERFGWTAGGIAKLRAQRAAIAALEAPGGES